MIRPIKTLPSQNKTVPRVPVPQPDFDDDDDHDDSDEEGSPTGFSGAKAGGKSSTMTMPLPARSSPLNSRPGKVEPPPRPVFTNGTICSMP